MPSRDILVSGAPAALSRIGQRRQVVIPKKIFDAIHSEDTVALTLRQGEAAK